MNSFMLTNEFLDSFVVSPSNNIGVSKDAKEHKKRVREEVKTNTLFWCLYNIVFNKSDNDMIKNRFTEEKRIKYEWILKLQSKKPLYKKHYKLYHSRLLSVKPIFTLTMERIIILLNIIPKQTHSLLARIL